MTTKRVQSRWPRIVHIHIHLSLLGGGIAVGAHLVPKLLAPPPTCSIEAKRFVQYDSYPAEAANRLFWNRNPQFDGMRFSDGIPLEYNDEWHEAKRDVDDCKKK